MNESMERLRSLAVTMGTATTKTDTAHLVLREAIVSGVLRPGEALHAGPLAEALGMSRIPVREAFRRLEQEGLVAIRPHVGASVRSLPKHEIEENLIIRGELEALATRLAAPRLSDGTLAELEALVAEMDACVASGDAERFGRVNRSFHLTIYRENPYPRLFDLIEQLWSAFSRSRSVFALEPELMRHSQVGHAQLLEALQARDAHLAELVIRGQKRHSLRVFDRIAAEAGDQDETERTITEALTAR
jgi:DNA-binding GntR family transcriptional regulator